MTTLLNVEQASELLQISVGSVYLLCQTRRIRHHRVGSAGRGKRGKILIPQDAIEEYLASTTVGVEQETKPAPRPRRVYKHIKV